MFYNFLFYRNIPESPGLSKQTAKQTERKKGQKIVGFYKTQK
jgi:hypothetical protein